MFKKKCFDQVFRHGDRAPDDNGLEIYTNDPYKDYPFEPMRLGGLTNVSKHCILFRLQIQVIFISLHNKNLIIN